MSHSMSSHVTSVHRTSTITRSLPEDSMYSPHPMAHGNGRSLITSPPYPGHRDMTQSMSSWTVSQRWPISFPPTPEQQRRTLPNYTSNTCGSTTEFPRYTTWIGGLYSQPSTPKDSLRDSTSISASPPLIIHSHRDRWRTTTSGSRH